MNMNEKVLLQFCKEMEKCYYNERYVTVNIDSKECKILNSFIPDEVSYNDNKLLVNGGLFVLEINCIEYAEYNNDYGENEYTFITESSGVYSFNHV